MARLDSHNTARYWQAKDLQGFEFLHADFTTHEYAPHAHDSFVVAVTETGGSEFKSRGCNDIADEQALLVFNPHEPHSGRMGGSCRWRYRAFYLADPAITYLQTSLGVDRSWYFTLNLVRAPHLIADLLELHRSFEGNAAPSDPLGQRELLVNTFGVLFQRHAYVRQRLPGVPADVAVLGPVLQLLHDGFAERLTLEQLSSEADLTPFQLIGAFKRAFGLTPHTYLTQLRLKKAIAQLAAGLPLSEVAVTCGFYDQSALTKHFKRTYGVTPLQYARALG